MVPGLISSVLDIWRPQCAVLAPGQGCPRGAQGRASIIVDEGVRRQHEFKADHESRELRHQGSSRR